MKVRAVRRAISTHRARDLRGRETRAEAALWRCLRAGRLGGWKWKRQVPFGPFILDFLCVEAGLAVEADGGVHEAPATYDARRTAYLEARGLHVLRFDNRAIERDLEAVAKIILEACKTLSPERVAPRGRGQGEGGAGG